MSNVPYISQLGNAPNNDCGPACALMLARWVGKGMNDTVAQWSKELSTPRQIDAEDNGTTAPELCAMLKKLGCDPILAPDAPYPHIALVDYAMLPVAQRYDQTGKTFGHWIVRLSPTAYHDPYHTRGDQTADAGALDAAIKAGADKYWGGRVFKVGIKDTPQGATMPKIIVSNTGGTGVNIRATPSVNAQKIGVYAEGDSVTPLSEQNGWTKVQLIKAPSGTWAEAWVKSDYLAAPNVAPPAPPSVRRDVLVGVNVISDTGALDGASRNGCRFAMVLGNNKEAADFARAHPDGYCMVRAYIGNSRWGADDFIRALGVSADMPPNLVLTLFNEADSWGSSPREMEERMRVETEFTRKARAIGCKSIIALGTFSVGNPQFAHNTPEYADTVRLIKQYYAPLWNDNQIGLDYHAYSPSMAHIYGEDLIWHERRWQFFFTDCGLDPTKGKGVFFGECGVDEDGVGGFTAHNVNAQQIKDYITRFIEIQSRPVVVNGVSHSSPVRGGAVFCYGNNGDPRWRDGYDIRRFGVAPFVDAGVWAGARRLSRAAKAMKPKG